MLPRYEPSSYLTQWLGAAAPGRFGLVGRRRMPAADLLAQGKTRAQRPTMGDGLPAVSARGDVAAAPCPELCSG
jgi:hypothetical protein